MDSLSSRPYKLWIRSTFSARSRSQSLCTSPRTSFISISGSVINASISREGFTEMGFRSECRQWSMHPTAIGSNQNDNRIGSISVLMQQRNGHETTRYSQSALTMLTAINANWERGRNLLLCKRRRQRQLGDRWERMQWNDNCVGETIGRRTCLNRNCCLRLGADWLPLTNPFAD